MRPCGLEKAPSRLRSAPEHKGADEARVPGEGSTHPGGGGQGRLQRQEVAGPAFSGGHPSPPAAPPQRTAHRDKLSQGLRRGDFPGGPAVETPRSQCRGPGVQSLVTGV